MTVQEAMKMLGELVRNSTYNTNMQGHEKIKEAMTTMEKHVNELPVDKLAEATKKAN